MTVPRVLIVAGSDSGGGAGIQADIKTVTMLGGFATTAITAITAQNTLGVTDVMLVPPSLVIAQMDAVVSDIGVDAVKIGMIGSPETAAAVAERVERLAVPIVFDPVMVATSGSELADAATIAAFGRLMRIATLVTPNAPELSTLSNRPITSTDELEQAAIELSRRFDCAVLAKGGHVAGDAVTDILVELDGEVTRWAQPRIETRNTHGTGCTMASMVATYLAYGGDLSAAVFDARLYVRAALETAPGFGAGNGPLNHAVGGIPWGALRDPFVPLDELVKIERRNIHRKE